jgi:hypothetical protein
MTTIAEDVGITLDEMKVESDARQMFADYVLTPLSNPDPFTSIQQLQLDLNQHWKQVAKEQQLKQMAFDPLSTFMLQIVNETNRIMPQAAQSDEGVEKSLGRTLIAVCNLATQLGLCFETIAYNFNPSRLEHVAGFEAIWNVHKAVGLIAYGMEQTRSKPCDGSNGLPYKAIMGVGVARLVTALHFLAFSSDWEVTVLFKETCRAYLHKDEDKLQS